MTELERLETELAPLRRQLVNHPIYARLSSLADIRQFMEHHIYAVWDFMSLLKALQQQITCVSVPWLPAKNSEVARFINEIVLGEETDLNEQGIPMSHYEMYLDAMQEVEADTCPVQEFLGMISSGKTVEEALNLHNLPASVRKFVAYTFKVIAGGQAHEIASAFTFGREDIIPDMFLEIINKAEQEKRGSYPKLTYYLNRHIELDGDEHGPLSLKLVSELCGEDSQKWQDVTGVAKEALQKRIALWDGIVKDLT